jgi:mannose-6-phosphate isomerase-like protein (cupin superfamily)
VQRVSEHDLEYRDGDSGVKYVIRGPRLEWGVILVKPGSMLGGHYHHEVEETFYVIEGKGTFYVNDQPLDIVSGDALRLEPTERHDVLNSGQGPLKLLFIKCPYLPQDKVVCPTSVVV